MECKTLSVVKFLPLQRGRGRVGGVISRYGARDKNNERIPSWPLLNSLDTSFAFNILNPRNHEFCEFLEEGIYGGLYYNWFGHFITESVPNLIAANEIAKKNSNIPIVFFVPDNRRDNEEYPDESLWSSFFFNLIGIDAQRFHFIKRPIEVKKLLLGHSPFPRKHYYSRWILNRIDEICEDIPAAETQDIYLSRSKWSKARTSNETILEEYFGNLGYKTVHMEQLSFREQIATIKGARHVAGCTGTALHWTLFSKSCKSVIALGYRSPLQKGISLSRGQIYFNIKGQRVSGESIRVRDFDIKAVHKLVSGLKVR